MMDRSTPEPVTDDRHPAPPADVQGPLSTRTLPNAGHYLVTETRGGERRTVRVAFEEVRAAKGVGQGAGPALDTAVAERLARPLLERAWQGGGYGAPAPGAEENGRA